jgi:hypothetical protein
MNNTRDLGLVQMGAGFRLPTTKATSLASRDAGSPLPTGTTCDPGAVKMGSSFRLPSTKAASMALCDAGPSSQPGRVVHR